MNTLYLHIGFSKTGTKALQRFLDSNREELKKEGYLYPESFCIASTHHKFFWLLPPFISHTSQRALRFKREESFKSVYKKLLKEFKDSGATNLLISSELFCNHAISPKLKSVKKFFKGFDIKLVVYLRRQDDFLLSMYNQVIKHNNFSGPFEEFLESYREIIRNLDYFDFLKKCSSIVGKENIIVRVYEKESFFGGSIFYDFLDSVGINVATSLDFPADDPNPGLPQSSLEIKRITNRLGISKKYSERINQILYQIPRQSEKASVHQGKELNPRLNLLIAKWRKSNDRVRDAFLKKESGSLFKGQIKEDALINCCSPGSIDEALSSASNNDLLRLLTTILEVLSNRF